jgi:hypothetical protein
MGQTAPHAVTPTSLARVTLYNGSSGTFLPVKEG